MNKPNIFSIKNENTLKSPQELEQRKSKLEHKIIRFIGDVKARKQEIAKFESEIWEHKIFISAICDAIEKAKSEIALITELENKGK